jgi:hypothetical protein
MPADVARDEAAEIIVAAARREADIEVHGLALERRIRLGGVRRDRRSKQQNCAGDG